MGAMSVFICMASIPPCAMASIIWGRFDSSRFLYTMPGPDFLLLYLVWFLVLWVTVLLVRHAGFDTPLTTIGGLLAFEGLGAARYFVGSAHGMHKWTFLFLMMIVGGF